MWVGLSYELRIRTRTCTTPGTIGRLGGAVTVFSWCGPFAPRRHLTIGFSGIWPLTVCGAFTIGGAVAHGSTFIRRPSSVGTVSLRCWFCLRTSIGGFISLTFGATICGAL